jgi:hypothetical protein
LWLRTSEERQGASALAMAPRSHAGIDKHLRLARTQALLTVSEFKKFRTEWELVVKEGRSHLEETCNIMTRTWIWPRLCADLLAACPNIHPLGHKALRRKFITEKIALRECCQTLQDKVNAMRSALVALEEAVDPVQSRALFLCLAAKDFYRFLVDVVAGFYDQMQVRPKNFCE